MRKLSIIFPIITALALASCGKRDTTTDVTITTEATTTEAQQALSYRELSDSVNSYYKNVDTTKEGDAFLSSLTTVISSNYQKFSYKEAWNILAKADEDPYNSSNVLCSYTGKSIPKNLSSDSKAWNREHTWAKSHGFPSESKSAYTDCHHLTATSNTINNARGDLDFGEVQDYTGVVVKDEYGNQWITKTIFEPRDEVKGDVARKLFYMMARYNSSDLDLTLVDEVPTEQSDNGSGKLGKLSTLLKWHYNDPVSEEEIKRNEVVYSYQKNRNPFIDHPEWVNNAFDSRYEGLDVNKDSVTEVTNRIAKLPTTVTLENQKEVKDLLNMVGELNAQEKLYVYNYNVLSAAKNQIDYLENKANGSTADITADFQALSGGSMAYTSNYTFTASDMSFTASCAYIGSGAFRLGSKNPISLEDLGLEAQGHYLKANFTTKGITKIRVTAASSYSGTDSYYILKVANGEYTVLGTGSIKTTFEANCDSYDGSFVIVITGNSPRLDLDKVEIYTK